MNKEPIGILVVGGAGRMGSRVVEIASREDGFTVQGIVDRRRLARDIGVPYFEDLEEALRSCGDAVVVDVSGPEEAGARIEAVAQAGRPLVEGTTGLDAEDELTEAARRVPVVVAPNFSPGIALLRRALREILGARGPGWDAAVLDRHHRFKKDRPSGTALLLQREIERARDAATAERARKEREAAGGRPVEVASFRQGGQVGEHTVYLTALEEELVLQHRAFDRGAFARGALLAAGFAAGAQAGMYDMDDVLGLRGGA